MLKPALQGLPKEVLSNIAARLTGLNEIKNLGSIDKKSRVWFQESFGSIINARKSAVNIALGLHEMPILNDMTFIKSFIRKSMSYRVMFLMRAIYFFTPDQPCAPLDPFVQTMRLSLREYTQTLVTELNKMSEESKMDPSNCIRCLLEKKHNLFQSLRPMVWQVIEYGKVNYGRSYEYVMGTSFSSYKIKKIDQNDDMRLLKFIMMILFEFCNFTGDHRIIQENVNTSWMYWVEIKTLSLVYEPLLSEFFDRYEQVLTLLRDSEQRLNTLCPHSVAHFVRFSWVFTKDQGVAPVLDLDDPFGIFFDDDTEFVSYET